MNPVSCPRTHVRHNKLISQPSPYLPLKAASGPAFPSPPLLFCAAASAVKPALTKTMESVKHSKANGFTTTSSPPLLIMRKKVFMESWWRRPCVTLIHLNGSGRRKNATHTCRVGRNLLRKGDSAFFSSKDSANVGFFLMSTSGFHTTLLFFYFLTLMTIYSLSPVFTPQKTKLWKDQIVLSHKI